MFYFDITCRLILLFCSQYQFLLYFQIFQFLLLSGYNPPNKCFQPSSLTPNLVSAAGDDLTAQIHVSPQVASEQPLSQNLRRRAGMKKLIFVVT